MKKIFIIALCLFLAACSKEDEIEENTKEEAQEVKSETELVYEALDGQDLKDSFSNREAYSSINFYDNGEFDGDFLSNSDIDGRDFGLKEEIEKTYNRSEIHKSVFSGKFTLGKLIEKGVYKLKLEDFTINNQVGPDTEIKYQYWVDSAKGLNKDDEYILYLKGAVLDDYLLENNQYKLEEIQIHDHEEEEHENHNHDYEEEYGHSDEDKDEGHNHDNHDHDYEKHHDEDENHDEHHEEYKAYGLIIYNKTQKLIFTAHDKWAITDHEH